MIPSPGRPRMTNRDIVRELELHVLKMCLAAVGGKDGDLKTCIGNLYDAVEKLVRAAESPR